MASSTATRITPTDSVPIFTSRRRPPSVSRGARPPSLPAGGTLPSSTVSLAIALPPLAVFQRAAGQEEKEQRRREVVDDPAAVDDALGKLVHVVPQVEIPEDLPRRLLGEEVLEQAEAEQEDEQGEGHDPRNELI